ncbi:uracil-DNA glycosylase [Mesobacillus subterraneus]|uniref:Uracil-DNA glycosylase n=1 Tax=Mesobacillus subterraneus TaxID=285983 RepID=A0A0D6ZAF8_9BACI|nr:uracil-DNA glycosylase [Mesobacillus subterraneus]KIY22036.1 uracil-DNA glycosylase [Mesobacillus subterraneus]
MQLLKNGWASLLAEEFEKAYYLELREYLMEEYEKETVYPEKEDIFNALLFTDYDKVKVVILGQDPYHRPGQAHGLSFSVKPGVAVPPSLRNIFKELKEDLGCKIPNHGYLKNWADQGVLLLNTVLTVRKGEAHSHKGKGWEIFTDKVIKLLNEREAPVIFILWGKPAETKRKLIDESKHKIIQSAHPSPLSASRGFFGSKPFSKVNEILRQSDRQEIDWQIEDR